MTARWRPVAASLAAAAIYALLFSGDALVRDDGSRGAVLLTIPLLALVFYRAWPALAITWERWRSQQARGGLRPSVARLVGTAILATLWTMPVLAITHLIFPRAATDAHDVVTCLIILGIPSYLGWPSVELKLTKWRAR